MKYLIQGREVSKDEFDVKFDKELEKYEPISEYWPAKENVRDKLKEQRYFEFPNGRYFVACEEEILEISYIVEEAEFDTLDGDAVPIAVAVWNEGYRKLKNEDEVIINEDKVIISKEEYIKLKDFYDSY